MDSLVPLKQHDPSDPDPPQRNAPKVNQKLQSSEDRQTEKNSKTTYQAKQKALVCM